MTRLTIICISFIIVSLMFAGQSYATIDSETILGIWLLDEGTGNITKDASGNGNDGTLMGSPNWVAGNFGNALDFSGSSSHVDCGNAEALNVDVFSVSFWCNIPSTQGWNHMISRGQHGASGSPGSVNWGVMMYDGQETILFETYNDTGWTGITAGTTTGAWHHVVATYDGDTMQLYHDGQLAATESGIGILLDQSRAFLIGARSDAGSAGGFFSGSIDEVGYFNAILAPEDIETIMNYGLAEITKGKTAANPRPADKETEVQRDVVLSWEPGKFAASINGHKVYFGESFNDVNDATGGVAQSANSYTPPQRLDFDTTYYWRVDEVNAPPTSHIEFKGEVWQFTTEPFAYPIAGENITATASSGSRGSGPENTIDGSGLDVNDLHSTLERDMWLSGEENEPNKAWIEYELDKVYKLHEMWVWNHNGMMALVIGFGFKDVTIEYSTNGTDYTTLGTTHEFARGTGAADYANTAVDLSGVAAKHIRLTANSNWGEGMVDQYGLSEVRFFSIPVQAREPSPDSEATDVNVDVTLGFRAGREAAEHNVYLSTDEQAVIDGNVPVTTVTEAGYGPLSLDLGTTYYWRVDEVNEAEIPTIWEGDIWNFTTVEYLVVDDFESYNDLNPDDPDSNRIFNTWIDGYDIPANGATVGYPYPDWNQGEHFVETAIVQGGDQAMPFFYSNTGGATSSEGTRTFAVPQDWTATGVQTLALHFHGTAGNTGQFYVKVNGTKVPYDGQASNVALAGWQAWNIDLASSGASLQSVMTLGIGIDGNGASGTLYFDDFRLYARSREFITPAEPDNAGLVGHWKFDEGAGTIAQDSSGLGNDGTLGGDPQWVAGTKGGALDLDGIGDYVAIDGIADDITTDVFTVSAWIRTTQTNDGNVIGANHSGGDHDFVFGVDQGNLLVEADSVNLYPPAINDDHWHFIVYVRDGSTAYAYVDGALRGTETPSGDPVGEDRWSIGQEWDSSDSSDPSDEYEGMVDDVRFYNYALSLEELAWLAGRTEPFDKPF